MRVAPLFLVLLLAPGATIGQPPESELDRLFGPGAFQTLSGHNCAVRYAAGGLDRGHHVLRRLEVLAWHFDRWSEAPGVLGVYLVSREHWQRIGVAVPYGLPVRLTPTVLLAPIEGDAETVRLWQHWLGADGLPPLTGTPLRGTVSEVATLAVADVLLQTEATRGFVRSAGLVGEAAWMTDLLAHVAALEVFAAHEERRLPEIAALFDRLAVRLAARRAPLESYRPWLQDVGEVEVERWLWYQAQLQQAARVIHDKEGRGAVKRLRRLQRGDGGVLRWPTLLERYPGLAAWRSEVAAAAGEPR